MTDVSGNPTLPVNDQTISLGTRAEAGSAVRFDAIHHRFGNTPVIHNLDLSIPAGELVALLGPSGCGKSTLLRILAGLQTQTSGRVVIGGEQVDGLSPSARGVGIVFQNYALFPHMSVLANVAYGLEAKGVKRAAAATQAKAMLEMVRMSEFAQRFPRELSGGQQQRIALARTLAVRPRILLLDEPFAALDKSLRLDMQIEIRRLQRALNITTIMVTHDQEEAMSMADRIAVLNNGRLEQFASAADIYDRPASPFVASFVGTANMLPATLTHESGSGKSTRVALIGSASARLRLEKPDYGTDYANGNGNGTVERSAEYGAKSNGNAQGDATDRSTVVLAVRPEQWDWLASTSDPVTRENPAVCGEPGPAEEAGETVADGLPVVVQLVLPIGPSLLVETLLDDTVAIKLTLARGAARLPHAGQHITLHIKPDTAIRIFDTAQDSAKQA